MAQGLYDITSLEPLIEAGCTLLTPNYRLTRRIKAEWDRKQVAAGQRVWEPVRVQPLESWLLGQWELALRLDLVPPITPLTSAQALELWRQVITRHEIHSPNYHLLRPTAAAEMACQARDTLLRWQANMHSPGIRQSFELDHDCSSFLRWLTSFEQRLAKAGQCTLIDCLALLPEQAGQLPKNRVALLGFGEIAPLERAALHSLSAEVLEIKSQSSRAERLLHSFSDKRAELQGVAAWAAGLHHSSPTATIGIVLSDMSNDRVALEYLLRREFDCLGENYHSLPVNFSFGIPLVQAPLVRDALAVLEMGLPNTTVPAVVGLLRSRFLDLPDAQSACAQRFVTRLYSEGREELAVADVREAAANNSFGENSGLALGRHLRAHDRMAELRRRARPSSWAVRFGEALRLWGWPGTAALDSLEFQQLELWHSTIDELRAYDAVCGLIDYGDALLLLRQCCTNRISQPQTADSPIQVLGPLEAAGLAFDHLWLCGMQSSSWPAASRPNPFIPIRLQSQLNMPHASPERERAFAEGLLDQYIHTSRSLHASFCRQVDGATDFPSPLLQEFTLRLTPDLPTVAAQWIKSLKERVLEETVDHQAPRLHTEHLPAIKGDSRLVEDQSLCPFRAFARHRLRVEPLGSFGIGLSAADRGSFLHAALFALWGEIGNSATLLSLSEKQQQQVVASAVQAALSTLPDKRRRALGETYWQLEAERLTTLLHEWMAVERERPEFSVVQREQEITLLLAQLPLVLRVDRIDQLPDGSRVIIDYKSGICSVQSLLGDRPAKPQLLLYSIAEPAAAAALAFAQVRPRDCRYVGIGQVAAAPGVSTDIARCVKSQMNELDWPTLNERWRQILVSTADAFVQGEAQVDPLTPDTCMQCKLQSLCRIDLFAGLVESEEAECV